LDKRQLREMKAFLFDLDGCIYHGDVLAPGSKELMGRLLTEGKKICFITNNSRETACEISTKLTLMGLRVESKRIITATEYVGKYIKDRYGLVNVKTVGSMNLKRSIEHFGHSVYPLNSQITSDIIVIGRDIEFNYEKLQQIVDEAGRGARVISTNPDMYHPGSHRERIPETGSIVSSVEAILDKKVEFVGKPAPYLFQYGMEICDSSPKETVMVGDNLKTDIKGGIQAGMKTVWIQGQQDYLQNGINEWKPDYVADDIKGLLGFLSYHNVEVD
jgi:4-nitrophenyl phosphatase